MEPNSEKASSPFWSASRVAVICVCIFAVSRLLVMVMISYDAVDP